MFSFIGYATSLVLLALAAVAMFGVIASNGKVFDTDEDKRAFARGWIFLVGIGFLVAIVTKVIAG